MSTLDVEEGHSCFSQTVMDTHVNPSRPNTGVADFLLQKNAILCCGEDANQLLTALRTVTDSRHQLYHEYRCYRFWKFPNFTLIWTGIGTGCLEPLLFELLEPNIVQRIVLIGTAGAISTEKVNLGSAYFINQAYLAAAGINRPNKTAPISHGFPRDCLAGANLQDCSIISTDYYYGFSSDPSQRAIALRRADPVLAESLATLWTKAPLTDMETAQFYHLCKLLGQPALQFAAIKGPANKVSEASVATLEVLEEALAHAFIVLEIEKEAATQVHAQSMTAMTPSSGDVRRSTSQDNSSKLMEEIKLYWTIQLAVGGILSYLGSHLTFSQSDAEKNILLCGVSFLLITMGAIYNVIGNYYARMEGARLGRIDEQENLFTPTLALMYLVVCGILGGITAYSTLGVLGLAGDLLSSIGGGAVGILLNWLVCRRVFRELYDSDKLNIYRDYSRHLRRLYLYYD